MIYQSLGGTLSHTGRHQPPVDSLRAEAALAHDVLRRIELGNLEGTCLNAIAAADAAVLEMVHRAVFPPDQSSGRAGRGTSRTITVKTGGGDVNFFASGKRPFSKLPTLRVVYQLGYCSPVGRRPRRSGTEYSDQHKKLQVVPFFLCSSSNLLQTTPKSIKLGCHLVPIIRSDGVCAHPAVSSERTLRVER